ncbi:MAG: hypothetical protein ACTSUE_03435 [Promethearchaeota archaeon]
MQTVILLPFFFIGIGLIGITFAQPLATSGLLVFVLGSFFILKERLERVEWLGVILMVVSIFLVSASGISGDVVVDVMFASGFGMKLLIFVVVVFSLAIFGCVVARLVSGRGHVGYAVLFGLSYAIVSISGQFVILGFDCMGNLVCGVVPWLKWFLVIGGLLGVVIGTVLGIVFSQEAFKLACAIDTVPVSQAINNVLPVFAGIFLFNQVMVFPVMFLLGIGVLVVSVILLARFQG